MPSPNPTGIEHLLGQGIAAMYISLIDRQNLVVQQLPVFDNLEVFDEEIENTAKLSKEISTNCDFQVCLEVCF